MNRSMKKIAGYSAVVFLLLSIAAQSGEVQDFEADLRKAYAEYRNALFMTNTSKPKESEKATQAFDMGWKELAKTWQQKPPPQYVNDPSWDQIFKEVSAIIAKTKVEVAENNLPIAHETLESVRDILGELHLRNDIMSFSDRMNAYHAVMEKVLTSDLSKLDATTLQELHEQAAVLKYLASETFAHPPTEAKGDVQFAKLEKNLKASVENLLARVRANDLMAIKSAVSELKPAYAKLFLKFG